MSDHKYGHLGSCHERPDSSDPAPLAAFVVWISPEGVSTGWEEWNGSRETADEDALEYATNMAVFDGAIERNDPYGLRNGAGGCELQEVGTAIGHIETQNRADDDPSYSAFDL